MGTYKNINEAVEARREAEEILFGGTAEYYAKWKLAAEQSPEWAEENPVQISVGRDYAGRLTLSFVPTLEVVERMQMAPASLGGGC